MRRRIVIGVVTCALLAGACSTGSPRSDPGGTTLESTTTTDPIDRFSHVELLRMLPTLADLSTSRVIDTLPDHSSGLPSCYEDLMRRNTTRSSADIHFVQAEGVPAIDISLGELKTSDPETEFNEILVTLSGCKQVAYPYVDPPIDGTVSQMSFQRAGDASEAWQVTFPVEGSDPVVLDVAVIQRGSVWLMVGVTDFGYVDPGDFVSLVRGTLSKFPVDA